MSRTPGARTQRAAVVAGLAVAAIATLAPTSTSTATTPAAFLPAPTRAPLSAPTGPLRDASPNPRVVEGADGYLFVAQDWTVACQDSGQAARVGRNAQALARAVRASGRDVVVTVGPDKSSILSPALPSTLPRQDCGTASRAAAWVALTAGPDFLDLRPALRAADRSVPVYWRKDTHWTPSGGAVYARALAERFDPALARRLQTVPASWSRAGDLARVLGRDDAETVDGVQLVNPGVRVQELPGAEIGMGRPARHTRAVVSGSGRVLPGLTVLVGDSFDDVAVEQLAPLFHEALFFWPGLQDSSLPTIVPQLAHGNRVVVETVERFAQRFRLFDDEAVAAVARMEPAAGPK